MICEIHRYNPKIKKPPFKTVKISAFRFAKKELKKWPEDTAMFNLLWCGVSKRGYSFKFWSTGKNKNTVLVVVE